MEALIVRDATREAAADVVRTPMTIDELFSAHAGFVWRTLRRFGVAGSDLEDQTQEVFIVAHRRLGRRDEEYPRAWLFAIARRCAAAYRRRGHRRYEKLVATLPDDADPRDPNTREELELLNRVFQTLGEERQIVFILHEIEGLSMHEVAEALQCPLHTAYTRYYAARRILARALEEAK